MDISLNEMIQVLTGKLELWLKSVAAGLPNFFLALIVFTGFWFAGKLARRASKDLLNHLSHNNSLARLLSGIIHVLVVCFGFFIALGIMELDKTVTSLLAGAGVVGLAIGFAFQEIASNFIAGILIAFRRPFRVHDIVRVNDYEGKITDIDLRTTRVSTFDGLEVIVPNKDMFTNAVTNLTATPQRRVDLEVGVSYGENLREVRDLVLKCLETVSDRYTEKKPEVFFQSFGDSSINFMARVWINQSDPISFHTAKNEMVILIKEAFDQNDIMIPFPIRTLDFGIKGGEKLSEVLKLQQEIQEKN
jgi:small conductance mechanosensitive channel